ncbi:hypothetical protein [Oceanospirillum maris]|uniref:hypothetical protein n=1 Tax=Oceanospirillum maris TaxID=64977 RepID=UPI00041BAA8E|nr:hypothetical protein [Oceanospirillum maris]
MSDENKKNEFPAIKADQLKTVVGYGGVNQKIRQAKESVLKAMVDIRGGYFGSSNVARPELEETVVYKRLLVISEALSELDDLTEPNITTRL